MAFDSIKKKISETIGDERKTDSALDKAEKFLSDRTGGKHDDKIAKGRDFVDGKVGENDARPDGTPGTPVTPVTPTPGTATPGTPTPRDTRPHDGV